MKKKADIYQPEADKKHETIDKEVQARREEIDKKVAKMPTEYGGRSKEKGLEPTRYDDWELKGRCIDF